jgi:HEAT repeat protein
MLTVVIFAGLFHAVAPRVDELPTDARRPHRKAAAAATSDLGIPPLGSLRDLLVSTDAATQKTALDVIAEMGPDAAPVVPLLTEMLQDSSAETRSRALQTLARIGRAAAPAVPAIVGLLKSETDSDVHWSKLALPMIGSGAAIQLSVALGKRGDHLDRVLAALRELGPQAAPALDAILEILDEDLSEENHVLALSVIASIGPAARRARAELFRELSTEKRHNVRTSILKAIANSTVPDDLPDSAPIRAILKSDSLESRILAAQALLRIDMDDRSAVATLINEFRSQFRDAATDSFEYASPAATTQLLDAMNAPDARERQASILAVIGWQNGDTERIVPAILSRLSDPDIEVRYQAAYAVGTLHIAAAACVPQLITALEHEPEDYVSERILYALEKNGTAAASALPLVLPLCTVNERRMRTYAIGAAASLGADSPEVFAILLRALDDPDADVRSTAAFNLRRSTSSQAGNAAEKLSKMLTDKDGHARWCAATALGCIGPAARVALPALGGLGSHRDGRLRIAAALAIARICDDGKSGVEELTNELEIAKLPPHNAGDFSITCAALGSLGRAATTAVPALTPLLRCRWRWRIPAANALARITGDPIYISHLVNGLAVPDVAITASQALADLGPTAHAAIPALLAETQSADSAVRKLAINAIWKIGARDKAAAARLRELWYDPIRDVRRSARSALSEAPQ